MVLKVSSWVKNGKEELIPTCQVNDVLNINSEDEIYNDLEYHDDVDLRLCWKYFDKNYVCYCLGPKYDGTMETHVYNLNTCIISFKEVESSTEEERIFVLKKRKNFVLSMYYVADITGFVLLFWKVVKRKSLLL